jgi:hypothetical protein
LLVALVCVASANANNSLRITATHFPHNILLVGRYHISNPSYCLAKKPSYGAPNYDQWISTRCAPYTVQRANFRLTVKHDGRGVHSDSVTIDGAFGDPSRGGTFGPQYLYCGLLATGTNSSEGSYYWTVTLIDPYRRSGYNISRRGAFSCQ